MSQFVTTQIIEGVIMKNILKKTENKILIILLYQLDYGIISDNYGCKTMD